MACSSAPVTQELSPRLVLVYVRSSAYEPFPSLIVWLGNAKRLYVIKWESGILRLHLRRLWQHSMTVQFPLRIVGKWTGVLWRFEFHSFREIQKSVPLSCIRFTSQFIPTLLALPNGFWNASEIDELGSQSEVWMMCQQYVIPKRKLIIGSGGAEV